MTLTIPKIAHLLTACGRNQYGNEAVSQLDHALQCAQLAEQAGETPETIVAALLHDLGHLLAAGRDGRAIAAPDRDDLHQYAALPLLRGLLPDAVLEPIRLHVDAKRYLCATEPQYRDSLSPASRRSLGLQGGAYSEPQARAFIGHAFAEQAVRLRRYDDMAKVPRKATPPLAHFLQMIDAVTLWPARM